MVEEGYEELPIKRQMAEYIRQEIHKQIKSMLAKKICEFSRDSEDDLEVLEDSCQDNQSARPDSGVTDVDSLEPPTQETILLLDSTDTLNEPSQSRTSTLLNTLEHTADSLINLRVERIRRAKKMQERRRQMNLPNSSESNDDNNDEVPYGRGNGSRFDLYCCYALYFFLVVAAFSFAIFYAWMPIIVNSIKKGKH